MNDDIVMEVVDLKKYYPIKAGMFGRVVGQVRAVDGVSFRIYRGTTMGLVGESGCGKTTIGKTLLRLNDKTSGQVLFKGKEIFSLNRKELRHIRPQMQIIFQDPYSSLSPRMPVGEIIGEAVREHKLVPENEFDAYITKIMRACGLQPYHKDRYPHEFSGGQRQRIGIARALAVQPEFIVCDEPVSALDVSIQAQIINMLEKLQHDMGLTYLFIAHDLAVVKHISQRIGVMYLGKIVEITETKELHSHPIHPYTRALLSAIPAFDPKINRARKRIILEGEIPNALTPPKGCVFSTRCPYAKEICSQQAPELKDVTAGHKVACHFASDF